MKAIGIITIIYSSLSILGSILTLPILYLEKIIFSRMPIHYHSYSTYNDELNSRMVDFFDDIFNKMIIVMPVYLVISVLLLLSGIKMIKKQNIGITYAKYASVFTLIWYVFYAIMFKSVFNNIVQLTGEIMPIFDVIYYFAIIVGGVFSCGYQIFLLIYLRNKQF